MTNTRSRHVGGRKLRRTRGDPTPLPLTLAETAKLHFLRGCDRRTLAAFLHRSVVRRMNSRDMLISPAGAHDSMYLLVSGTLTVHLERPDSEPISEIHRGESVGELSLIDGQPRSAYVMAKTSCVVLEADCDAFWGAVRSSPCVTANLLGTLAARLRGNNRAISSTRRQRDELGRRASFDALTGLYNRSWLDEVLPRLLKRARKLLRPVSVVLIDVDHFKRINDVYGHPAGDRVLASVARVIRQQVRPLDITARLGGEEFIVVLPDANGSQGRMVAERVRQAVRKAPLGLRDGRRPLRVTISLGVSEYRRGLSTRALIERADQAMYKAKDEGRDRTCCAPSRSSKPENMPRWRAA